VNYRAYTGGDRRGDCCGDDRRDSGDDRRDNRCDDRSDRLPRRSPRVYALLVMIVDDILV